MCYKSRKINPINFKKPDNFVHYGSAEKYYSASIHYIRNEYPYDGSLKEKLEWEKVNKKAEYPKAIDEQEDLEEPLGGAHNNWEAVATIVKETLNKDLLAYKGFSKQQIANERYEKFRKLGKFEETVSKKPSKVNKKN